MENALDLSQMTKILLIYRKISNIYIDMYFKIYNIIYNIDEHIHMYYRL